MCKQHQCCVRMQMIPPHQASDRQLHHHTRQGGCETSGARLAEQLGLVDELVAAIVARAGVPLAVLVGHCAAYGLHDRGGHEVLAGDELQALQRPAAGATSDMRRRCNFGSASLRLARHTAPSSPLLRGPKLLHPLLSAVQPQRRTEYLRANTVHMKSGDAHCNVPLRVLTEVGTFHCLFFSCSMMSSSSGSTSDRGAFRSLGHCE